MVPKPSIGVGPDRAKIAVRLWTWLWVDEQPRPGATVTCTGTGHKFVWRSLMERTGGAGSWPVTATTNWAVAWRSNTGATGTGTLTATTGDRFEVGEYRQVLVQRSGG